MVAFAANNSRHEHRRGKPHGCVRFQTNDLLNKPPVPGRPFSVPPNHARARRMRQSEEFCEPVDHDLPLNLQGRRADLLPAGAREVPHLRLHRCTCPGEFRCQSSSRAMGRINIYLDENGRRNLCVPKNLGTKSSSASASSRKLEFP